MSGQTEAVADFVPFLMKRIGILCLSILIFPLFPFVLIWFFISVVGRIIKLSVGPGGS